MAITGHAGQAAAGRDIVCAAVSSLAQALHGYLLNHAAEIPVFLADRQRGKANFCFEANAAAAPAYELCRIGFLQIAMEYPDFVRMVA